ncbi:methylated-DNA--[protein]-cysteine S-methyltransferase [Actinomycetospora termitidis]|uniref:Methylated-DNA--[protein]-cysteine S-methyltransferase n=1 Tax=Actinomycetospora termitidis TaxID=3053470 RepID=A0ABT7MDN0_9PSEU|nr:methylated-DNA--[protein]-cysteine S-methyltransferase [Actinomycetospora sp. Odt1-22]MDL5158279.1 methylated-DNA--[protein]-cysteine S-methyltransferase [Actinomycetospora sp. Odt1-22]
MTDSLLARLSPPAVEKDLSGAVMDTFTTTAGPLGDVLVASSAEGVTYLRPVGDVDGFRAEYRRRLGRPLVPGTTGPSIGARTPVDLRACSSFERDVLDATASIPAGQTRPYGWVAREVGSPAAVRAVGTVLARNPVPLIVPCHRVTKADGSLGRYMLGEEAKARLLADEGADLEGLAAFTAARTVLVGSDTTGIACLPSCHHARRITDAHRVSFRSAAAARDAGYRGCTVCRPGW